MKGSGVRSKRQTSVLMQEVKSWAYMRECGLARDAQVQALRSIEPYLGLEALYVLGTNCVDNGPRAGLEKFLNAASANPATVLHYEFMQARVLKVFGPWPGSGRSTLSVSSCAWVHYHLQLTLGNEVWDLQVQVGGVTFHHSL